MAYDRMHQETAIAREQGTILFLHHRQQLLVIRIAIIRDIDSEQAQISREFAEMTIRNKARVMRNLQAMPGEACCVGRRCEDRQRTLYRELICEIDRCAADEDEIDFGVRHATRFDDIFDRCLLAQSFCSRQASSEEKRELVRKHQANVERAIHPNVGELLRVADQVTFAPRASRLRRSATGTTIANVSTVTAAQAFANSSP